MKSTEVYKIISNLLYQELKNLGYKKAKGGMLKYSKNTDTDFCIFWFQISRDGFDEYAGSKFVIEFAKRKEKEIGHEGRIGGRIPKFLQETDFKEIVEIQNGIIKRLKKPPKNHPNLHINDDVTKWYLQKFEPINQTYTKSSDIWFRYYDEKDINMWIEYLGERIKNILIELERTN